MSDFQRRVEDQKKQLDKVRLEQEQKEKRKTQLMDEIRSDHMRHNAEELARIRASQAYDQALGEANSPSLREALYSAYLVLKPTNRVTTKRNGLFRVTTQISEVPIPFDLSVTEDHNGGAIMNGDLGEYLPIISFKISVGLHSKSPLDVRFHIWGDEHLDIHRYVGIYQPRDLSFEQVLDHFAEIVARDNHV